MSKIDNFVIWKAKLMLNSVKTGIRVMREKIEKERPDKKQYIQNAINSERDLEWVYDIMTTMEKENYALGSRCFDLEKLYLQLKQENDQLKKTNEQLSTQINL
jgi:hypothetical protein